MVSFCFACLGAAIGCQPNVSPPDAPLRAESKAEVSASLQREVSHPKTTERQDAQSDPPDRQASLDELNRILDGSVVHDADRNSDSAVFEIVEKSLDQFPNDSAVLYFSALVQYHRLGLVDEAIQTLRRIQLDEPEVGPAALGMRSDWLAQTGHYEEAIAGYRNLLDRFPEATEAHRQLAALLNRLGRRHEAARYLRNLVRLGDVRQAELASLLSIQDPSLTSAVNGNQPSSEGLSGWVGPISQAHRSMASHQPHLAVDSLASLIGDSEAQASIGSGWDAALALLGRAAVDANDKENLRLWWEHLNPDQLLWADHWFALSRLVNDQLRDTDLAIQLMVEAIHRDPTDRVALGLLANWMNQTQRYDVEDEITQRMERLKRTVVLGNRIGGQGASSPQNASESLAASMLQLAEHLDQIGRELEANAWRMIAVTQGSKVEKASVGALQERYQALQKSRSGFPTVSDNTFGLRSDDPIATHQRAIEKLSEMLEKTKSVGPARPVETDPSADPEVVVRFVDRAREWKVDFRYRNADPPRPQDLSIFQQFGGAVCATDFDRDGWIDLFLGQGGCHPNDAATTEVSAESSNRLFRSLAGAFQDCSEVASVEDQRFTMAVAAGDLNQDGWPDLLVSNFGNNECFINNADGTFSHSEDPAWNSHHAWSSGHAIADLTGNGIPDVFEIRYLNDPRVFETLPTNEHGRAIDYRGPESYQAAGDVLYVRSPTGHWDTRTLGLEEGAAPSLGVVVGDFDNQPGNEIFVANDTEPNRFWKRGPARGGDGFTGKKQMQWNNFAKLRGCAFSSLGGSGASMGIATADFDQNGRIDFHITNFLHEPAHLYLQNADSFFSDHVTASGLARDSIPVLGFGTVAFDFENDGDEDIAVLNGHIENLEYRGMPHKMPAQLFVQESTQFQSLDVDNDWAKPSIGRGLIRTDLNRDGLVDMVATFQDRPVSLLENQTISHSERDWLNVRLVGVESERSAVGARLTVEYDGGRQFRWLTSGGGYACQDEPTLFVGGIPQGLGVDLIVAWPSGLKETFKNVETNQVLLVVEGQARLTTLP
ncbi:FG-GAP-like repeat-containing protein [Rhodopirellula islandica]|uniref:FG-GAP-like repeat-containing protein n=1 Tax=Rhodopirellula islandica TaxID=595434 RepID=UPI0012378836|nr:FG-GAP-like repeat-containing protein [Rhodopirellula islandica]